MWYSSANGNVVADTKEIDVAECLPHKVNMSWTPTKVEPGKEANLILQGANDALCSIGKLKIFYMNIVIYNQAEWRHRKRENCEFLVIKI